MRNERGLTLVEVLATIFIVSIVVIFMIGIQVVIQKQFKTQLTNTGHLTNLTIAMKSITKDLRLADIVEIPGKDHLIIHPVTGESIEYVLKHEVLKKNDTNFIYEIKNFEVVDKENNKIYIKLVSKSGKQLETKISIRGE